ncbi:MAG: hypothetical protein EBZ77_08055 [Chitinophagia bacterium]|nr:hypothetical protein [Chitinophagia bacterium]
MRCNGIVLFFLLLFLCLQGTRPCFAQVYDTASIFATPIDTRAFVRRIKTDTSFFKAFKTMRLVPFRATTSCIAYNRQGSQEAILNLDSRQVVTPKRCRKTETISKTVTGPFFDKHGNPNYYTAEMFLNLFFTEKWLCNENDIVAGSFDSRGKGKLEKNKMALKQLIFNPGSKIEGVPFMGDKASVFDDDEVVKYILSVSIDSLAGQPCYKFSVVPRPEYSSKVVYNELTTCFAITDYSIVARNYSLSFKNMLYRFDVAMKVSTTLVNGRLLPAHIYYNGNWHVFTKAPERMQVVMDVTY